jgi:tryptophanase
LIEAELPVVQPIGGHAIYVDAEAMCPHLSRSEQPAHALACALYEHAGVRATRIGSILKTAQGEAMELVRLAIPRRTYSQSHLDYVAAAMIELRDNAASIGPVSAAILSQAHALEPEFQAA